MATRDELVAAVIERYRSGGRNEKGRILDEFVAVTGFHRKHAMRVLRGGQAQRRSALRPERRRYDDAARDALVVIWEASDRLCGKRLKPLAPVLVEAMERHGHLQLAPEIRMRLLAMSAATMDRALRELREHAGGGTRRRTAPSSAVRRSVPVRTFSDWQDPPPGFVEADLVAHSGPAASGSFVQTLVLTDVATGWTECAPLLVREQRLLSEVLTELRKLLPFDLLGFDTDNDSVFMNETVRDYCRASGIEFTRCRPYRKNDQAFVEQKNGAVVRRIVGYRRYEGLEAAALLAKLYASVRLFVRRNATVRACASAITRPLLLIKGSWPIRARLIRREACSKPCTPTSIRSACCGTSGRDSSSWRRLPTAARPNHWHARAASSMLRRSRSSSRDSGSHGGAAKCARRQSLRPLPSGAGAALTRSCRSLAISAPGSRRSRGGLDGNCSSGSRARIRACTRTRSSAPSNAG